jgi:hypothetical protein
MKTLQHILEAIHQYLNKHNKCNEHALIQHLSATEIEPFTKLNLQHAKDLFSAHFLVMHALYQLQNQYQQQTSFNLAITSIRIQRSPYAIGQADLQKYDTVKDYYLDIKHYFETQEEDVHQLLNQFWGKYLAQDEKNDALETLSLPSNSSYTEIKKQYKRLAQTHHPDKGGCEQQFKKITAAKRILDKLY